MSAGEIILILFIYLLLFGAKGVPALAQTLGKAMYQFRNATKDVQNEIMKSTIDIRKEAASIRLDQVDVETAPKPTPPPAVQPAPPPPPNAAPGEVDNSKSPI